MPGPRVLFVKLSSLGDVIHHLPAVTDLAENRPDARIAWAVEEAYADLVTMHPAVREAIPVGLRALRANPLAPAAWRGMARSRHAVRSRIWDFVVDTQGLAKSAVVARFARAPVFGLDAKSARERMATRLYDVKIRVPRSLHAVERNRRLVGEVFGYAPQGEARYGLLRPDAAPDWVAGARYVVMLHAASRAAKRWPEERWIELGRALASRGYVAVLPGGSAEEREAAKRLAASIPGAIAAPRVSLVDAAALLAHAAGVIGVDTGLTHLAVALDVPTVGIYCATDPALTGLHGAAHAVNVGGRGQVPGVEAVVAAIGIDGAPA
ncbi:MAG TPA: lipopolysaccharide heptosyltransferase I [Usitatibacter sp.]